MTSRFVYVTYIRAPREKVWEALTKPEFTRQYWFGMTQDCSWETGASWAMKFSDGRVADSGEVVALRPPEYLELRWRNEFRPELREEGYSTARYTLEQQGETVKLTVTHEIGVPNAKLIDAVSGGWPMILSNLKTLLETGTVFVRPEGKKH